MGCCHQRQTDSLNFPLPKYPQRTAYHSPNINATSPSDPTSQLQSPLADMAIHIHPAVMTVCLEPLFSFTYSPPPSLPYYGHSPVAPCNSLELDLTSDTKARTRCLADCVPPPLSITCPIPTLTVPPMRASVPADVHLSCPLCACISSLLLYVSLHLLCTLPDPLTCVVPRPLYAFFVV